MRFTAFEIAEHTTLELPALIAHIPAGDGLALCDEVELVDLNYLLSRGSADTLVLKVEGESMIPDIEDGSYIVVSRSAIPQTGDIVVASVRGEHTLKRLQATDVDTRKRLFLVPSNPRLEPREVKPGDELLILAVVRWVISRR